jgi:ketosteroid isomerase-like protein
MTDADQIALVRRAWTHFMELDVEPALAEMTDDVRFTVPGATAGVSGVNVGKERMREIAAAARHMYPGGASHEIHRAAGGDGVVVMEWTVRADVPKGRYENQYCGVFDVTGGKLSAIRLYYDTLIVSRMLTP